MKDWVGPIVKVLPCRGIHQTPFQSFKGIAFDSDLAGAVLMGNKLFVARKGFGDGLMQVMKGTSILHYQVLRG